MTSEPVQLELPFDLEEARSVRADILHTAEEYITKDRANEHGDMEDNFSTIASYWSEHLRDKLRGMNKVSATDVAIMMALLKIARMKSNEGNRDNYVDGCGYLACGGELASREIKAELEAIDRGG